VNPAARHHPNTVRRTAGTSTRVAFKPHNAHPAVGARSCDLGNSSGQQTRASAKTRVVATANVTGRRRSVDPLVGTASEFEVIEEHLLEVLSTVGPVAYAVGGNASLPSYPPFNLR
jgi:hypothetical protein